MAQLSPHIYILLFSLFATICVAEVISLRQPVENRITDLSTRVHVRKTHDTLGNGVNEPLDLLDIVLVASVDGSLHALNRTSGHALWTIASTAGDSPSTLGALVSTRHPDPDPDVGEDDEGQEIYVIEPQSGEIYVMASPGSPLQRLPLSMPQLVEMSPYTMSGTDSEKIFVGRKETSLLLVELETGRIKATINPNSACPWDPFEDITRQGGEDELDLDELDGSKPPSQPPTEVFIGRTDYHVSIHTRPLTPNSVRPPAQNLSFSTYGPNNQDHALQTIYRRTADEMYIQSLPNGKIMSFKAALDPDNSDIAPAARVIWGQSFSNPVVAVFDVVKTPSRPQPFVLLQPRISLQDLLPNVDVALAAKAERFPNLESAYVGMVEETGSLYAMSPDRYPLVVFGDANFDDYDVRGIEPPLGVDPDNERDFPVDLDSITRSMKRNRLKKLCRAGSKDHRCLTGVRRLENSRFSPLLDGAATVPNSPFHYSNVQTSPVNDPRDDIPGTGTGNASVAGPSASPQSQDIHSQLHATLVPTKQAFPAYAIATLILAFVFGWLFIKRDLRPSTLPAASMSASVPVPVLPPVVSGEAPQPAVFDPKTDVPAPDDPVPESQQSTLVEPELLPNKEQGGTDQEVAAAPVATKKVTFGETVKVSGAVPDIKEDAAGEGEESEGETLATPGKRKGSRRRGKKKKKGGLPNGATEDNADADKESAKPTEEQANDEPDADYDADITHVVSPSRLVVPPPSSSAIVEPSLIVSDNILGFGSHGTVVFKGSLQGRAVAVKRLLQDFVTLALREVTILQESDDHPNVIRYYYQEARAGFLYIALELCPASLADIIERPDQFRDISIVFEPKKALRQITSGLRHLHALKIIHRDIKPQNILISTAKPGVGDSAGHRMLISDFGLCKKLDLDQTSFVPTVHGAMAAGTVGWRAPEILRGEVKLDEPGGEESQSSRGSTGFSDSGAPNSKPARLTKSVDIFALGCLFYYVLSNGGHPYGDRYEREMNIFKDVKCLDGLERFGEEGADAADLITRMLSPEARARPDTTTCLLHPYFWTPGKRLNFLQDASDRFEIMCRDPRDPMLILLETGAFEVVGNDWNARLDKWFIDNLGKYRKYDGKSVQDLLRALRNKKHHYQDLPDNVKRQVGSMPEGFLAYFTKRFPTLFLHVHTVISSSSLRCESMFRTYFELIE